MHFKGILMLSTNPPKKKHFDAIPSLVLLLSEGSEEEELFVSNTD